jgi:hypothetical protein
MGGGELRRMTEEFKISLFAPARMFAPHFLLEFSRRP